MEAPDIKYACQISVGLPVWGVEKYIKRCLLSILDQDFDDMEVLVINDCTPDKSIDIVNEIASGHPKGNLVRIINQPHNMGCWAARNRILEEAQGKYILLIDSDDYFAERAISKLFKKAEETNAEATYGSVYVVDEDENPIQNNGVDGINLPDITLRGKDKLASFANDNIHKLKLHNFIWNVLLRSDFTKKHQLKFRKTKFWDDVLFNADMQPQIESATLLSDITYYYVIRPNSLSNFQARDVIKIEEIRQHIKNQRYLKEQCLSLKEKTYYEIRMTKVVMAMFYTLIGVIRNRTKLSEPISNSEIHYAIRHPLSFMEIIKFEHYKTINLMLWMIGKMPSSLSVFMITIIGKAKKLI